MEDRNVQFPNRYRLTKVPGTDDIYDFEPVPGEVTEEGTFINKSTLLKDATAELYGLDTDAVPDDVLNVLSRFQSGLGNEYLWQRQKTEATATLKIGSESSFLIDPSANTSITVYTDATAETDGTVSLSGPVQYSVPADGSTFPTTIIGTYYNYNSTILKIASTNYQSGNYQNVVGNIVTSEVTTKTETSYVNSPSQDAYPPATPDGYTYTSLGQVGNETQEIGTYVGNGKYGKNNPNSLTFEFAPKVVFILGYYTTSKTFPNIFTRGVPIIPTDILTTSYAQYMPPYQEDANASAYSKKSEDGKTITWYNSSSGAQLNNNLYQFYYIAFG